MEDSAEFSHERTARQPGEPTSVQWDFVNPNASQEFQFKLRAIGATGSIANPTFEIDRSLTCTVPVEVKAGQTLLLERDSIARVYDAKGNQVKSVRLPAPSPRFKAGPNRIEFDAEFQGDPPPKIVVSFKTLNPADRVKRAR